MLSPYPVIVTCPTTHLITFHRKYLIPQESPDEKRVLLSLIDIIFAYCYDMRITQGDPNVESAHTVSVLSPSLSWLEDYSHPAMLSIKQILVYSARRVLIYPYLRMWKLVKKCLVDVSKILLLGQRVVLQCVLDVHRIFEKTDTHYLLNKVFMDDYCVWLQSLGGFGDGYADIMLRTIGKECNAVKSSISKEDMGGDLDIVAVELTAATSEGEVSQGAEIVSSDSASVVEGALSLSSGFEGLSVSGSGGVGGGKTKKAPLIQVIGEEEASSSSSGDSEDSDSDSGDSSEDSGSEDSGSDESGSDDEREEHEDGASEPLS
jgi:protein SHQ1